MAKALTTLGMLIAGLIVLVFAVDMAIGIPFGAEGRPASSAMDIGMIVGGVILLYLSWAAWREQT